MSRELLPDRQESAASQRLHRGSPPPRRALLYHVIASPVDHFSDALQDASNLR